MTPQLETSPIYEVAPSGKPREKLAAYGPKCLSDQELLAVLIGSGSKSAGVHYLARQVLKRLDGQPDGVSLSDLVDITGIGVAKATLILSALEFSRRRIRPHGTKIRQPQDVVPLLNHWANRDREHFIAITLNGAHEVIATRVVTIGLVNSSPVHPREVFSDAIADRACAVIAAHNHPSGNLQPSEADKQVTKVLYEAGKLLGIALLDHIIFSTKGFYSFQEQGMLNGGDDYDRPERLK